MARQAFQNNDDIAHADSLSANAKESKHGTQSFTPTATVNGDTEFARNEFYKLLEKSRFVAQVIAIQRRDQFRLHTDSDLCESPSDGISNRSEVEWQALVAQNLPDWLFWVTDILTTQAKLVAQNRPMSRVQLSALMNDRLLRQTSSELRLKSGRSSLWTTKLLRRAINLALSDITTPGAVTLRNVARRINVRSKELIGLNTPLTGKHLQKLLKQNNIDWLEIKRSYKHRLITRDRSWLIVRAQEPKP